MKILVTGCAGFIGYHLTKKILLNKKYKVFGIDNIIFVSEEEMYHMGCNVFSISNQVIVSEKKSVRITQSHQRITKVRTK